MHYRLVSGHWIGRIISKADYTSLPFDQKFLWEVVEDPDSYEFQVNVQNKIKGTIIRHVFDYDREVTQFIQLSGWFSERDVKYWVNNLDEPEIEIETETAIITYKRQ